LKIIVAVLMCLASAQVIALTVVMQDGCPVSVDPGSQACNDQPGAACVSPGAPVRWSSSATIDEIGKKSGSAELHNCGSRGPTDYQCIIRGNSGDHVDYYVTANGCTLDPTIILK